MRPAPSLRQRWPWLLLTLCLAIAAARIPRSRAAQRQRQSQAPPTLIPLPAALLGTVARVESLDPADARLARRRNVRIERRRFGPTRVAITTVRGGMREHHPPQVCLRASGFEVSRRRQLIIHGHCLIELTLRHGGKRHRYVYTYFDGQRSTCSLYRRIGDAAAAQLLGRPAVTWATVAALDSDAARARAVVLALLPAHARTEEQR